MFLVSIQCEKNWSFPFSSHPKRPWDGLHLNSFGKLDLSRRRDGVTEGFVGGVGRDLGDFIELMKRHLLVLNIVMFASPNGQLLSFTILG